MTDRSPLLTDEEIRDEAEEFTVNPISTDSFRQGFRLGAEFSRPRYEADRAKLLDEIEVLKLAKQELRDGLIKVGALLDSIMSFADVDPDTQVKQIWRKKVAAVREQYAHAQPRPKLEKTRRALKCGQERLNIVFLSEETTTRWNNLFYEALAELDAVEGVKG